MSFLYLPFPFIISIIKNVYLSDFIKFHFLFYECSPCVEGVSATIGSDKIEFKGSKEFKPYMIKDIITDKLLNFSLDEDVTTDKETGRSMCRLS